MSLDPGIDDRSVAWLSVFGTHISLPSVALHRDHASTFGGNPLACAAGLAVGKVIDDQGLLANVDARGNQLRSGLEKLRNDTRFSGLVKDVRG
jgi:4-aminobutyrate aminotransferase-like enzyme